MVYPVRYTKPPPIAGNWDSRLPLRTDMSAAAHADLLFVKLNADGHSDLSKYCIKEHIKHVEFYDLCVFLRFPPLTLTAESLSLPKTTIE